MRTDRKSVTVIQFTATRPYEQHREGAIQCGWWRLDSAGAGQRSISDSRSEMYEFTVQGLSPGEHTIAVRAYDRFENVGAGKTTIQVAGKMRRVGGCAAEYAC